jgi:NADPH:quinone reductase-like Zn-dependent oxidoreductase
MKAIIWTRYDPPEVPQLKEVDKPVPAVDEVFIKVAANVFPGDGETHRFQIHPRW